MTREEMQDKVFNAILNSFDYYASREEYDRSPMKYVIDEIYNELEKNSCDRCVYTEKENK
jgi:hypothetical protein